MKILWIHNFNPEILNAGIFMHQAHAHLEKTYGGEHRFDMHYLGNLRNPFRVLLAILRVAMLSRRYDIVHAQFGSMCAFVGMFSLGRRRVVTLRGSDWHATVIPGAKLGLHHRLQIALTRIALRAYDVIIVVSNRMRQEVAPRYPKAATLVIPSPVDSAKFYPADKHEARARLGLPQADRLFLFPVVSTTNPIKRPWLVEQVRQRLPANVQIITASGIPHDGMRDLYNSVDGVVLVSYHEGWPNVIKEALMCNVPFIATDVSDLAEIATRHPSCKIVPPSPDALLDALVTFTPAADDLRTEAAWMDLPHLNQKLVRDCYQKLAASR